MAEDTIAAVATPPGEGGIGIVRLSGPEAFAIAERVFRGPALESHRVLHGHIVGPDGEIMDEVVLLPYRAPHSYTGEDVIEISCHGGSAVLAAVLRLCLSLSARAAEPGEFTRRAFLNGKMDLAQAEAVCDLIRADAEAQRRMALRQVEGELSRRIGLIRDHVMSVLAVAEAAVDFSEEVGELDIESARERLTAALEAIRKLRDGFRQGRIVREGAAVAIAGLPNVGKSSLLNALLGADRAIVTDIPGTTRDTIEDRISLDGVPVALIDTAGLRATEDAVERAGVRRTNEAVASADMVLLVLSPEDWRDEANRVLARDERCLLVLNKSDVASPGLAVEVERVLGEPVVVSAKTGEGLDALRAAMRERILGARPLEPAPVSRERHDAALADAERALRNALETLDADVPADVLCVDLREALHFLGLITGETVTADIIDRIFSDFCIGK